MKIHPTSIEGFDTLEDAAIAVGKMRYDALSVFLAHLSDEMCKQRDKDLSVGKSWLAHDTDKLIYELNGATDVADMLFEKYKKHMAEELDITPEIEYKR